MPDYRTIPPTVEGVCRYSITGKCCVYDIIDGQRIQVCPPNCCSPPKYRRMIFPADYWDGVYGTEGQ